MNDTDDLPDGLAAVVDGAKVHSSAQTRRHLAEALTLGDALAAAGTNVLGSQMGIIDAARILMIALEEWRLWRLEMTNEHR